MDTSIRNQMFERILTAMSANINEDGTTPTPTDLQAITVVALSKYTAKNYEAVSNLFRGMIRADVASRDRLRRFLRRLSALSCCGALLAHFDYETGYMETVATQNETSGINDYVRNLFALDGSAREYRDEIQELVENVFVQCTDCNAWESANEMRGTYQGDDVCRRCASYNYEYSDYYEALVHTDYSANALDRDGSEVVIHSEDSNFCWDDDEEMYVHREYGGMILGNYHSSKGKFVPIESPWTQANCFYIGRPLPNSAWAGAKYQRFFGVELEIEAKHGDPRSHAENLNDILNKGDKGFRCFFERDGSLSHGFEIVTQPMGLDMHAEFWKWTQSKVLTKGLLSHNTSTCGLHVHVTKAGLTKMQISKLVAFINHPDNRDLIEAIARRYDSSYARLGIKKVANAYRNQNSRYEAINLEPNRTVEFRLFKGTLKYESLMSALEFTNALVNFCNDQSGYGFNLTTEAFVDFIEKPALAHDTKFLRAYLDNKLEAK